jgi:ATP-dependent Clp protease ATP-binding subunit ClpC
VFEHFDERARQVVVLAQDEARSLSHGYIGTEHILLGLLRQEEGVAARALDSLGISRDEVRERVVGDIGRGQNRVAGMIPFTPRAKRVLELSLREASSLGQSHIGTEHVLLGLARENDGVAARILYDLGAPARRVASAVVEQPDASAAAGYAAEFAKGRPERRPVVRRRPRLRFVLVAAFGLGVLVAWATRR